MKKTILLMMIALATIQMVSAQLKVLPGNNVSIGYSWLSREMSYKKLDSFLLIHFRLLDYK